MKIRRLINFSFFIALLLLSNFRLFPQEINLPGLPIIRNYPPSEHGGTPQNWGIVQDKIRQDSVQQGRGGVMYFANTGGVLEYDGVSWRLIEVENDVARTIAVDDNEIIYVGGVDQFGYLEPDQSGKILYRSLISLILAEDKNFGDIWSIWQSKEGIFFQSASHLFLIKDPVNALKNKKSKAVKTWISKSVFSPAFLVGEKYFIPEAGRGILELLNDSLKLINDGEIFKNLTVYSMLPFIRDKSGKEKILIGTENGFYTYDGLSVSPFKTEIDNYIIKNQLYFRGAILSDGSYAFGTQSGGLVIMSPNGKLKQIINKSTGLNDNTVWFVYPDSYGELWLGLNNGIAKVNYPSPITLFDSHFGLDGVIFSMNENSNKIYVTTTNGVYYASQSNETRDASTFKKVEGINAESWELLDLGNYQLAATTNGVYKLTDTKAAQIKSDWRFAYSFCHSKLDKNLIYVGLHDGLAALRFQNGEWRDNGRIPGISEIIFHVAEDEDGIVWLCTYNKGLIKLVRHENGNNSTYSISRFGKDQGLTEKEMIPLKLNGKIIFGSVEGLFSYNSEQESFNPEKIFGEHFTGNYLIIDLKKDISGNVWVLGRKKNDFEIGRLAAEKNGSYSWKTFPLLNSILETELFAVSYRLYPDKYLSNIIWITANEKLYRFDVNAISLSSEETKYNALIRNIKIGGDSVLYSGGGLPKDFYNDDTQWKLYSDLSSIEFSFSSTSYIKESANWFQYYLEGFESGWSEWTKETSKEYTNLPPGSYKFRVRANNVLNIISEEASLEFFIPTPWYKSVWAFSFYIAVVLLLIWWLVNLRLRFLEKRTVELESIVNERTREVREQKDILEVQAKKLLELDRLKSNFFTNISHEFRTPLTLIRGQIENILDSTSEEKIKSKLKIALSNSKRLHALINQLLELSRLEAGEIKLKVASFDIISFLKKVLAAFDSYSEKKKLKLEFISDLNFLEVYFDREKMEEIFNNLLSNAIKFTPHEGKISLSIKELNGTGEVEIAVKDTGIGINEEALKHIFDRFYQADSSQTREYEGTGIGLAIVKELVELHDGIIKVESLPGEGSEFKIYLKKGIKHLENKPFVEIIEMKEAEQLPASISEIIIPNGEKLVEAESEESGIKEREVVLVVEDNNEMRSFINENLSDTFNVIEAKNGEEGVRKAVESIPDLIITDVMMPVMNGYDLTQKLRKDQRTSHIPIIMLTAKADEESKLKGLDLGVDDYLIKPFSRKELMARVGNLIKLRKLLKERYKEISAISIAEIEAKPLDQQFLEKVFELIKANLENSQFGVTTLAVDAGMSVSQLNRKLNALINQSAGKLIRSTKLDYAAQLLKNKAGNISEIAYRVGFSDTPGFTHSFKEKFGMSPSEYVKSLKVEE